MVIDLALNCSGITARNLISMLNGLGFDSKAICGILANWYHESSLKSNNLQNSYNAKLNMTDEQFTEAVETGKFDFYNSQLGFGYGLAQWTSKGRRKALYSFLKNRDRSIDDLQGQVDYFYEEIRLSYKSTYNVLMDPNKSIHEKCEAMLLNYEKPASVLKEETKRKTISTRNATADEFYTTYFKQNDNIKEENMAKTICVALGAGHYLYTQGKRCLKSIDPNETREWVLNDRICDIVQTLLSKYEGVNVVRLDDTTGKTGISLETRKKKAETAKADIYISVHHNAGINGGTGGGTVVYCYNTAFNRAQAQRIYDNVVAMTGLVGNRSTKVANGNDLYECYAPTMASYIIENGFMDSLSDTPIILTVEHAEKTAAGIVNFLVSEYSLKEKVVEIPVEPDNSKTSFVPASELRCEEVVAVNDETLRDLAERNGKTLEWLLNNNPGFYPIGNGVYLVDKHTSIYVG